MDKPARRPTDTSSPPTTYHKPRAQRACDRCRNMKVRCHLSVDHPEEPCRRCAQAGHNCDGAVPGVAPHTTPEARLIALEEQIATMKACLTPEGRVAYDRTSPSQDVQGLNPLAFRSIAERESSMKWTKKRRLGGDTPSPPRERPSIHAAQGREVPLDLAPRVPSCHGIRSARGSFNQDADVVDQGILPLEEAVGLFRFFLTDMIIYLPAIKFPPDCDPLRIRRTKPVLFLAILVASAGIKRSGILNLLNQELLGVLSVHIFQNGEKSIELIQALQISSIWCVLPLEFDRLQLYQWINLGASMAMEIGIDRPPDPTLDPYGNHTAKARSRSSVVEMEERRTWLTCYLLSISTVMVFRRPSLIRWNAYLVDCIHVLSTSPEGSDSDRHLCQWVELAHISEDVSAALGVIDPQLPCTRSNFKAVDALEGLRARLKAWKVNFSQDSPNVPLQIYEYSVSIYMHEVILRNHKPEAYWAPYEESMLAVDEGLLPEDLGLLKNNPSEVCITTIYALFDTFLDAEDYVLPPLPVFTFSRLAYAVLMLMKIYCQADDNRVLRSGLSKTRIALYLKAMSETLGRIPGDGVSRAAVLFQGTLETFQKWFEIKSNGRRRMWRITDSVPCLISNSRDFNDNVRTIVEQHLSRRDDDVENNGLEKIQSATNDSDSTSEKSGILTAGGDITTFRNFKEQFLRSQTSAAAADIEISDQVSRGISQEFAVLNTNSGNFNVPRPAGDSMQDPMYLGGGESGWEENCESNDIDFSLLMNINELDQVSTQMLTNGLW